MHCSQHVNCSCVVTELRTLLEEVVHTHVNTARGGCTHPCEHNHYFPVQSTVKIIGKQWIGLWRYLKPCTKLVHITGDGCLCSATSYLLHNQPNPNQCSIIGAVEITVPQWASVGTYT